MLRLSARCIEVLTKFRKAPDYFYVLVLLYKSMDKDGSVPCTARDGQRAYDEIVKQLITLGILIKHRGRCYFNPQYVSVARNGADGTSTGASRAIYRIPTV